MWELNGLASLKYTRQAIEGRALNSITVRVTADVLPEWRQATDAARAALGSDSEGEELSAEERAELLVQLDRMHESATARRAAAREEKLDTRRALELDNQVRIICACLFVWCEGGCVFVCVVRGCCWGKGGRGLLLRRTSPTPLPLPTHPPPTHLAGAQAQLHSLLRRVCGALHPGAGGRGAGRAGHRIHRHAGAALRWSCSADACLRARPPLHGPRRNCFARMALPASLYCTFDRLAVSSFTCSRRAAQSMHSRYGYAAASGLGHAVPAVEVQRVGVAAHTALVCHHHRAHLAVFVPAGGAEMKAVLGYSSLRACSSMQHDAMHGMVQVYTLVPAHHLCRSICTAGPAAWPKADIMKKSRELCVTTATCDSRLDISHCSRHARAGGQRRAKVGGKVGGGAGGTAC